MDEMIVQLKYKIKALKEELKLTIENNILTSEERDIKIADINKDINECKEIINLLEMSLEINERHIELKSIGIQMIIVGIFTVYQLNNPWISLAIVNIDSNLKMVIILGLYLILLSNKIFRNQFSIKKELEYTNKKPSLSNVIRIVKVPTGIDLLFLLVLFIGLFCLKYIMPLYSTFVGYMLMWFLNILTFQLSITKIKDFYFYIDSRIAYEIEDLKDRLTFQIAVLGLIVSLISIFM